MQTSTVTVTFLARGKRYGKWEKLELKNASMEITPDNIIDGCKNLAKEHFSSDYVEIQNVSKLK